MKKTWILGTLTAFVFCSAACDPKGDEEEVAQSGTSGEEPEGETERGQTDDDDDPDPSATSGEGETEAEDETEGEDINDTEDECSFLGCDTGETGVAAECDLWAQDCMDGEKCMPWANDGGNSWNASKCTPLSSLPSQAGDACTVEGSGVSGVDSCDAGLMCWNVDEENNGTCVPLCQGSQNNPLCDNIDDTCIVANDGFLPLCLPNCDPLSQDCQDGEACYPSENGFVCAPDASGPDLGGYGDACEYTNACDPSLLCVGAAAVPGCDSARCCTHFCDLAEAEPSALCGGVSQGQECISFFPEGQVLPGYEDTGFCTIPE